jgi:hypothetical protein
MRFVCGLAHPRLFAAVATRERGGIYMKLITALTLVLIAVLAPLSAYANRTDEVQAPYWDRPDPPSQPVP